MSRTSAAVGALVLLFVGGCVPTCKEVCNKALSCELDSPRTPLDACIEDCERQRSLYKDWWEDEEKVDLFVEHRRCVMQSSCDELAEGVCYDEELFIFAG